MNDKLSGDQQKLAEKREKEDAKDVTPKDSDKDEQELQPQKSPWVKGKKIGLHKNKKYKNHMFDLSKYQAGLTNKQYGSDDLTNYHRKVIDINLREYTRDTGVKLSEFGWDHKKQELREAPKKGMGGVVPFQIGKKSIGGRINTSGTVGSKVPKINRPFKQKRRVKTNTVVVAARQQVLVPGSSQRPSPKVVYGRTPVMLNGNMRS